VLIIYGKVDKDAVKREICHHGLFRKAPYISKLGEGFDYRIIWAAYKPSRDGLLLRLESDLNPYVKVVRFKYHHPYYLETLKLLDLGFVLRVSKPVHGGGIYIYPE